MTIEAVLWDFGGVLTTSPFEAFNRFEAEHGLPLDFIRQINATNPDDNAWAQFERSQLSLDGFDEVFATESKAAGHEVRGRQVIELLSGDIRPAVVAALTQCAQHFKIGCITNNVTAGQGPGMAHDTEKVRAIEGIMAQFDVVIESSKVGVRKPHPDIYLMACTALDVAPEACVYLDDLGINLKPARALGMTTIKVVDPELALLQLAEATGLTFSS